MCLETDKVQNRTIDVFRAMILEEVLKSDDKELLQGPSYTKPLCEMGIIQRPAQMMISGQKPPLTDAAVHRPRAETIWDEGKLHVHVLEPGHGPRDRFPENENEA